MDEYTPLFPKGRWTPALLCSVTACVAGSSFQFGYNTGVVNTPDKFIRQWVNISYTQLFGSPIAANQNTFVWSTIVSIFSIGGMIGGACASWVAERAGRKKAMLFNNLLALCGALLCSVAKPVGVFHLMILGRLITGINAGINTVLAPMYLLEIAPRNLKGEISTLHQVSVVISILLADILGLQSLLGNDTFWPILFAFPAAPALLQIIVMSQCPESPRYTMVSRGDRCAARRDLKRLRGDSAAAEILFQTAFAQVNAELDDMQKLVENEDRARAAVLTWGELLCTRWLAWPLFIAVMMMVSQQLSGINAMLYYSSDLFRSVGLSHDHANFATLGMTGVMVIMTLISAKLVDGASGRRPLHLAGLIGMWASSIIFVLFQTLQVNMTAAWPAYVSIGSIVTFAGSFAIGPGSIPWFYACELFNDQSRAKAQGVATFANWMANFVVGLAFLPMKNAMDQYSMLVFSLFLLIFIIFTYYCAPETKNVPAEQTIDRFRRGSYFALAEKEKQLYKK